MRGCRETLPMWFYSEDNGQCQRFPIGGCYGESHRCYTIGLNRKNLDIIAPVKLTNRFVLLLAVFIAPTVTYNKLLILLLLFKPKMEKECILGKNSSGAFLCNLNN